MTHEVVEELADELELLPVRTEILNIDTGETGRQEVALPLGLRDRILTALRTNPPATGEVGELVERLRVAHANFTRPADMEDARTLFSDAREAVTSQVAEIARLQAQVDAMREALAFYAKPLNWGVYRISHKPIPAQRFTHATDDRGERARAALSGSNSDAG